MTYCVREQIPFTKFEDFSDILSIFQDVVAGKTTVEEVSARGLELFKAQAK